MTRLHARLDARAHLAVGAALAQLGGGGGGGDDGDSASAAHQRRGWGAPPGRLLRVLLGL